MSERNDETKPGAEGDPKPGNDDAEQIEGLGEKGREAIRRERDARKAADDARTAAEKERDALLAEKRKREAEDAKRTEEEAERKGEFEQLATKRESERDEARSERDALKTERDDLRAFFDGRVTAALKDLPDALKDFDPGEDAPFAQRKDWLEKALKRAEEMSKETARGNGPDPRGGGGAPSVDAEARALASRGGYSM